MPQTPEIINPLQTPNMPEINGVQEIPTSPNIPLETLKQTQVSVTAQQFTAQVSDSNGVPLINTPKTTTVAVQIPAVNKSQLSVMAQGSQDDSGTWWAAFWERLIIKSKWFHWNVFFKKTDHSS